MPSIFTEKLSSHVVGAGVLRADVPQVVWTKEQARIWQFGDCSDPGYSPMSFARYNSRGTPDPHPEIWEAIAVLRSHGVNTYWKLAPEDENGYPVISYVHHQEPSQRKWVVLDTPRKML